MNTNDRSLAAAIQRELPKGGLFRDDIATLKDARKTVAKLHERIPSWFYGGFGLGFKDGFRLETDRAYAQGLEKLLPIVDRLIAERDRAIEERDRITRLWDRKSGMI